jgi:hypothetical protein
MQNLLGQMHHGFLLVVKEGYLFDKFSLMT